MNTTVAQLARRIQAEERTLRRAVSQGTVRCDRTSPRRIEVSDREARFLAEHWGRLQSLRRTLRTEPNVRLAVVFGSLSLGELRAGSDVDLLVDLDEEGWERRQALVERLEATLGGQVDVVVLSRALQRDPALVLDALRDGRVVVDRDGGWEALRRRQPALRRRMKVNDARETAAAKAAVAVLTSS